MSAERRFGGNVLRLTRGDITEAEVDAVVNAANEQLILGGGVAGAIRMAGGPSIQEECRGKAPIRTGEAVATGAGRLPARYVIHAVGPRGGDPDADRLLESAVVSSLRVAEELNLGSIAFPAISTGIFGYPLESCARIMTRTAAAWLADPGHRLTEIRVVLFDDRSYRAFEGAMSAVPDPPEPG
jgi:O-acetyl-ADP-ribose deacetylase (regulator of RNase III)